MASPFLIFLAYVFIIGYVGIFFFNLPKEFLKMTILLVKLSRWKQSRCNWLFQGIFIVWPGLENNKKCPYGVLSEIYPEQQLVSPWLQNHDRWRGGV